MVGAAFQASPEGGARASRSRRHFRRHLQPLIRAANLRAAAAVLKAAGYGVIAFTDEEERPLCCGRTHHDAGYIEEARREAERMVKAAASFADKGIPVVGLEPSWFLMMRDGYRALASRFRKARKVSCRSRISLPRV